ncbi:ABC transporter permease [Roseomonas sp. OT10]|uniref:ABC transporter permease n=1 Tax=Roseomonas cutis TaxID=2897332 RepID=UPI001E3004D0|nr:ABC transporter permease [Roseomonas sp. OT10]UFN48450.1 ABC transporter permease [Roseomonas sp. OT10]
MSASLLDAATPRPGSRWTPLIRGATLPLLLLAGWQAWAMTLPEETRAPSPARVATTFLQLVGSGDLPSSLSQSLGRVISGFAIALVLGIALGIAMGSNRTIRAALEPIVEGFRPVAPMAMLPIAIMWFGTGTPASLSIVSYAAFFPLLLNTVHGVAQVDRKLLQAARTMGVPRHRILLKVVLPAALPGILLGARLALGVAWTAIIAAELAVGSKSGGGSSGGIGAMMFVFYAYSIDLNGIVVCMVVIGVVALAIDRLFRVAERHLVPWRQ